VVNSKKTVQNPLNPSRTFFAGQLYFFRAIEEFNKNLSFFDFKHHIGVGQQQKTMRNPLNPSRTFFAD